MRMRSRGKPPPIALIATPGGRELARLIDQELVKKRFKNKTFIKPCECPRFAGSPL
jgi:predicted hydrolase (HD superfamily)